MIDVKLNFRGYWREVNRAGIPNIEGVYLVYRCIYNTENDTVSLKELVYIGQSKDVNQRIAEHSLKGDFTHVLKAGETLCYSVAEVESKLDLVENALVFMQKPRCNDRLKDNYTFEDASFDLGGRCSLVKYQSFTITKK